ncbi:hypothetical protein CLAIMM_00351 isoform 1 [Cladophialophora immunda]|nr:hypothetical protein CLAIMM_00351 isoform 1 [Cladophialophora immunda]
MVRRGRELERLKKQYCTDKDAKQQEESDFDHLNGDNDASPSSVHQPDSPTVVEPGPKLPRLPALNPRVDRVEEAPISRRPAANSDPAGESAIPSMPVRPRETTLCSGQDFDCNTGPPTSDELPETSVGSATQRPQAHTPVRRRSSRVQLARQLYAGALEADGRRPAHMTIPSTVREEADHFNVKSFLEQCMTLLGRMINIPLIAVENIVGSKLFVPLLMLAVMLGWVWYFFSRLETGIWAFGSTVGSVCSGGLGGLQFVVKHTSKLGNALHRTFTLVKQSRPPVVDGTNTTAGNENTGLSTYVSILCTTSLVGWLATLLHVQCTPTIDWDRSHLFGALNNTSFELDHWAGISVVLAPYVNTCQLAPISLDTQHKMIEYSQVSFKDKDLLLGHMWQYRGDLYSSGRCLHKITLTTDTLIKVMVYNLRDVNEALQATPQMDFGWWRPSKKKASYVIGAIEELLETMEIEMTDLIKQIGQCTLVLGNATHEGERKPDVPKSGSRRSPPTVWLIRPDCRGA